MKILFYTDLHAADQTPRSRTGSYKKDILDKLRAIVALANEHEVDYLINGADTFDRKSAWRVSHSLVREMIEILRDFPGDRHLTCVGTHDVPTGQLHKLDQQPLGILEQAGVITVLGEPRKGNSVLGTRRSGPTRNPVVLFFVPARYNLDSDPANYAAPDTKYLTITTAHGMIVPPGKTFFADYTDADTIERTGHVVLYGHPHTPDGVYKNKHGVVFCGPGSVSRRDASKYNRERTPQVALITVGLDAQDKGGTVLGRDDEGQFVHIELLPLPCRPGAEVFQDLIADEEDENTREERLKEFVENLKTANIRDDQWGPDQLLAELDSLGGGQEATQLARTVIENLSQ